MKNLYDQFLYKNSKLKITSEEVETSDVLRVCFQLGNVCTYDCSYCGEGNKNGTHKWPEFSIVENLVREIDRVYKSSPYNKKEIVFEYLGGEVTVWKDFEKLLVLVHELGNKSWIITNGVRSLRWWEEHAKYFEVVTLSAHLEFCDIEHLCSVGNIINDNNVFASITVLMYPPKWNECLAAIEYLKENSRCSCTIKPLVKTVTDFGEPWDYTTEEHDFIKNNSGIKKGRLIWGNSENVTIWRNSKTGKILRRPGDDIIVFRENNFYNWKCYVGIDTLYLQNNGDIRVGAMCEPVPPLGNWKRDELSTVRWPFEPVICKYLNCNCQADFRARKFKNNDNNI